MEWLSRRLLGRLRLGLAPVCLACLMILGTLALFGVPPSAADDEDDPGSGSNPPSGSGNPNAVPGQLVVAFTPGSTEEQQQRAVQRAGGTIVKRIASIGGALVSVDPSQTDQAARQLARDPVVRFVEPNLVLRAFQVPNDPLFGNEWGLRNVGQAGGTAGADVHATSAWDMTTSAGTTVAVVDTGVDRSHPDLAPNIWTSPVTGSPGWNFIDGSPDSNDDAGHGTHVAGIIGARGNNGIGIAGIDWNIKIMPLKFLDANGQGNTADAADAIGYAVANGARVVNASWGGPDFSEALYEAVQSAGTKGVLFVAAAGNDGQNTDASHEYPADFNLPNVVSVAATDRNDNLADFSNFGPGSVGLGAPGDDIYSTVPPATDPSGYTSFSGTSMATPFVSGAAALYLSTHPQATPDQIRTAILQTVDPLPALAGKVASGGRLDIAKLLGVPPPSAPATPAGGPTPFKLLRPRSGHLSKRRRIRFVWQRSHAPTGIAYYRLYMNGRPLKTVRGKRGREPGPFVRVKVRRGKDRWFVRAYDHAGHVRTSTSFRRGRSRKSSVLFVSPHRRHPLGSR